MGVHSPSDSWSTFEHHYPWTPLTHCSKFVFQLDAQCLQLTGASEAGYACANDDDGLLL
jgi:hypothetical protein